MANKKLTREDVLKIVEEARENGDNVDLSWADLEGVDLSDTDLRGVNFSYAELTDVDLFDADISAANLNYANFSDADLSFAVLSGSDLNKATLSFANLFNTEMNDVDITTATIGYTIFADVDLSDVNGLESVKHNMPSEISIGTLYKSKGKIPDVFLRGCGVPDNFIEYVHSLTNTAFDYYSCFISHSTKDKPFVEQLYAHLQANGVRCWYSEHDMQGGKTVYEQIDHAIRVHEKLLLILSENSMESDWVKTEIRKAKKREEKEGKRVLFPISLVPFNRIQEWEFFDSDRGRDLAMEIREFYIPCFAGWEQNHDAYKKEFDKLLRDLKASEQSER
ncbi:MAG: toll/interleukin-1 receptor domain-containing protein [Chlorobiales bacterium]|nr:toll/interleukin-1 receptor domain-containing protein [Chlorobiales bacterium]